MIKIRQDESIVYLMQDKVIAISHYTKRKEAVVRFVDGTEVTYYYVVGIEFE